MSESSVASSMHTSETASPSIPARPVRRCVDVVLGHGWKLEVDHVGQAFDVEAARRDSVATRIATRPALKSSSARTRALALVPWIAAARIPSAPSCSAGG